MATVSRIIEFIPTIGDNDKKDPKEQFKVELRAVDVSKKQLQLRKFVEMKPKELMKEMMSETHSNQVRKMLTEHFIGFINFNFEDIASEVEETANLEAFVVTRDELSGEKKIAEEKTRIKSGDRYIRSMTIEDMFAIGEFELAMEIFMYMIGSSQLKKHEPKKDDGGTPLALTAGDDREDEEKNSESPSGSTPIH